MLNTRRMIMALAAAFIALGSYYNSEAAVFNVTTPAEFQAALDTASSNGQDDTINVAAGIYNITTRLTFSSFSENFSLTIQGAGVGSTILDGGNSVAILFVYSAGQVFIKDMTFRNGNASGLPGGLYYYALSGTVENCEFIGNSGGGAYVSASGAITLNKNTFTSNSINAPGFGAGLYATSNSGTITLTGNEFSGNTIDSSGYSGGGAYINSNSGAINLTGNIFRGNSTSSSSGNGAGFSAFSGGPVTIVNNVFSNNSAGGNGGGASVGSNNAGGSSIVNNTFVNNSGSYGGGLYLYVYTIGNVYNNIIYGNTALFEGGDIAVGGGTTKIFNNDFTSLTVWSAPLSQGNNINAPPSMTADFELQSDSPCINKGDNSAPSLPTTDFEGNPRVFAATVDIGAYEFFVSGPYVDLSVSNVDNPNRVLINQEVTYTVTITNLGTATAASVTLTDTLPPTSTYVSATPTQGTCSESGKIVTCNIGAMASSATATVTIVIDAPGTAGTITNIASASTPSYDPFPANNAASQDTTVLAEAENVYLAKTGQGACYDQDGNVVPCAGTGQDGDTKAGVSWPNPRFTNNGDGTMTDNLTGLMWLKDANCMAQYPGFDRDSGWDDGQVYWQHALDFVAGINSGSYPKCAAGHTDWHLPNINEFQSLVNFGYYEENCGVFPCWGNDAWLNLKKGFLNVYPRLWTSNTYPWNSDYAYIFDLSGGYTIQDAKNDPSRYTFPVWPVRIANKTAPARVWKTGVTTSYYAGDDGDLQVGVPWPSQRFTNNLDGTVTDELTGLMWLQDTNCIMTHYPSFDTDDPYSSGIDGSVTWQHALDFVKGMNNGTYLNCNAGFTNWRLPNIKELHSLGNYSGSSPGLPPGWAGAYWSSTSFTYQYSLNTTYAYVGDTGGGISTYNKQSTVLRVWPVRTNFGSDLSVSKQSSPDPVGLGSSLTYTVSVTNHGPADATAVSLTDSLPAGVIYVSAVSSQGTCTQSAGTVNCSIGDMASGVTVPVTIVVNAPNIPGTIVNTATVACTSVDPNLANNTAREKTWVGGAVTLTIIKEGNGGGIVSGPGINCGTDCTQDFTAETDIALSATPDANSFFAGWDGDACFGASGNCNLTINGNTSMTAVFNKNMGPVSLPTTGQKTKYAAGDDGDIRAGMPWPGPRFEILYCDASGPCANQASDCDSDSSTDAIIDNLTGLMWARDGDIGNMSPYGGTTWDGAITYIVDYVNGRVVGNGLCGYKDWRGPNVNELLSLLDSGPPAPSYSTLNWLTTQGFVKLKGLYWSSTSDSSDPTRHGWDVNMGGAGGTDLIIYLKYRSDGHYLLPVRNAPVQPAAQVWKTGQTTSYLTGDPNYQKDDGALQMGAAWPSPRFTDPDGVSPVTGNVVLDKLTGIMWTKDANLPNNLLTWQGALDFIANMNSGAGYGGYKDWRLPNWIELRSLWDFSRDPMLPSGHPFINVNTIYWSSTTSPDAPGEVLVAGFSGVVRGIGYDAKTYSLWVWPIRGGTISSADLSITKSAPPDPISGGSSLTYTINVTNNGPGEASGVTMQDTLPAGTAFVSSIPTTPTCTNAGSTVSCNLGSLANGATVTITIVVTVPTTAGWIRNVATVSSATNDPNGGNNTAVRDTRISTPTDPDSDGVSSIEESGPGGGNTSYDGNNDGIADNLQTNVTSMHTFDGSNYVTLASTNGTALSSVQAISNPSPGNSPTGVSFPYGFFGFTVEGVTAGGSTTVTIYLPAGAIPNTYYKYGPEPGNPTDHWYEFLYDGQTGAVISGNVITLHFVDGLRGDDDLTANGLIVDKGAPGLRIVIGTVYVSKVSGCNDHNPCWPNIQNGIGQATDPSIIEITQETYEENIVLDVDKEIILEGGWDTDFTSCSSYTTIKGSMAIKHGTIIIEYIILK